MNQIFGKLIAFLGVAGLGVVAGAAISAPGPAAPAALQRPAPVEVRTQVIHRTVRVVHHARPRPVAAPPPSRAVAVSAPVAAPAARPSVAPATPAPPRLTTRSSGAKGGGEGDEHEGGGDD